jgi:hypothetical protein
MIINLMFYNMQRKKGMTFRKLAKLLDKNAMTFVNSGDLKKAVAAIEVAAYIRRLDPKIQKAKIPTGEN